MRIIHTADWHLGKLFYGSYLTEDQGYVWEQQLLPAIKEYQPHVIIAAGDIYDRSVPPAEAVELFDEIITKIGKELKIPFLCIAGNHDSAERLAFGNRLLAREGIHVFGPLDDFCRPVTLSDEWGAVDFIPLPYAEPAAVRYALGQESCRDHQQSMAAYIAYQLSFVEPSHRKVGMGHAFVGGGISSDSERPLSIGGTDCIESSVFSPFHYTALGHLHGPQMVGSERVRYSGSLLKYSFGEYKQKKGVECITLGKDGDIIREQILLNPKRDVRILEGTFDELMGESVMESEDYILARLTDKDPVLDGLSRLRKKFPYIRALECIGREWAKEIENRADIRKVTEEEMFATFAQEVRGEALSEAEQAYMAMIWKEIRSKEGER